MLIEEIEDEKALEERLRQKYSSKGKENTVQKQQNSSVLKKTNNNNNTDEWSVHVHLCHVCNGEGNEKRLYEARVIEVSRFLLVWLDTLSVGRI